MIKKINYEYIKDKGPTIIFMHGWGMDKSSFDELVHFFYNKNSILSFDFLGFGKSDEVEEFYDTYEYAYQIFLLIKELNIDEVILIGHSFGGRISIILSTLFDVKVIGCILTSSAGLTKFSIVNKTKIILYKLLKKLCQLKLVNKDKLKRFGSEDYKKLDDNMRCVFVKIINQDLGYLLHKINCKVYIVWDKKDDVTPYWMAKKFDKKIRYSKVILFKYGKHFALFTNKNKSIELINHMLYNGINKQQNSNNKHVNDKNVGV